MGRLTTHFLSIIAKIVKIVLIIIILIFYRVGFNTKFLGVGGTFNLNEEKTPDVEILASGVFVGFLVYHLSVMVSKVLTGEKLINDCIMNLIGVFLWIAVGGTALHYWDNYAIEHRFEITGNERSFGLALGSLCIINSFVHAADVYFTARLYMNRSK